LNHQIQGGHLGIAGVHFCRYGKFACNFTWGFVSTAKLDTDSLSYVIHMNTQRWNVYTYVTNIMIFMRNIPHSWHIHIHCSFVTHVLRIYLTRVLRIHICYEYITFRDTCVTNISPWHMCYEYIPFCVTNICVTNISLSCVTNIPLLFMTCVLRICLTRVFGMYITNIHSWTTNIWLMNT